MKHQIALIENDQTLAAEISKRLQKIMPGSNFFLYSPESVKTKQEISFSEDVLLYNNHQISPDELINHQEKAILIPLYKEEKAPTLPLSSVEIKCKIITEERNDIDSPAPVKSQTRKPGFRKQNYLHAFISFADPAIREKHIQIHAKNLLDQGIRVIRLNIMPGISLRPLQPVSESKSQIQERKSMQIYSGISELLLRIASTEMTKEQIAGYLQMTKSGVYEFGIPQRSDDLISCPSEILQKLVQTLYQFARESVSFTNILIVIEGIPFQTLYDLCIYFDEYHIIRPRYYPEDFCYAFEFNELEKRLSPQTLRFSYTPPAFGFSEMHTI